ncbi:TIR domain-containing protein [Paenibacillus wynnii]|uniref:TIR domain-containing protein n=1 Tax=Paenibacillus wynnii TaxID=268407 RepID=UPI002791E740|nr:TIR domain-containing protein [Paenibacillus wynnii]MDQ0195832.1 hypothetical protein [Paenibacillus wynnii]
MGLPRTFIGFSSKDIHYYHLMQAWKKNESTDFYFTDCQLATEVNSNNEAYIKKRCRERINMCGYYIMLIGDDTRHKHTYVKWEAEVAKEKGCTIIGVNLNGSKHFDSIRTPAVITNIGAIFVPYTPKIIKYALENYQMKTSEDYYYKDGVYQSLGLI